MQQTDLKAKYREANDSSGEIFTISIDGIHQVSQREEFRGLSNISYSTTFNQISEIVFEYDTSFDTSEEFKRQFFAKVEETLNAGGNWVSGDSNTQTNRCGRYLLEMGMKPDFNSLGGRDFSRYKPYVKLEDLEIKAQAKKAFQTWQNEDQKKKREEFKP